MDPQTVQVVTASVGVAGTLAGALLTQMVGRRSERDRREAEDKSRWLSERLRVASHLITESLALERDIWSAAAQLDRDDREERMPGYTTILLTPEDGIPGVIDSVTRDILVEAVEDTYERLHLLEETVAQISLIGTPTEADAARDLHELLWDAAGQLETFSAFDVAADAVQRCRMARDEFTRASRDSLRVDGAPVPLDRRQRALETTRDA